MLPLSLRKSFVISVKVVIEGSFSCNASGVVIGRINGDVFIGGKITIGKKGIINGNIKAAEMLIRGTITGNVHCSGKMMVASTACIQGNIITQEIEVHEKAVVLGSITKLTHPGIAEERIALATTNLATLPDEPKFDIEEQQPVLVPEELPQQTPQQTWF